MSETQMGAASIVDGARIPTSLARLMINLVKKKGYKVTKLKRYEVLHKALFCQNFRIELTILLIHNPTDLYPR